jgi:L-asparaginase II
MTALETFPVSAADELAVVERGGFIESRHSGSAIVLSPDGTVVRTLGDLSALILPRSTLKPFQAIASLSTGLELNPEQLGLATASHSGTARHVAVVRSILSEAGIDESALRCPPDWPIDSDARNELIRTGGTPSPITMNCSGKHAAMLAACVSAQWSLEDYLDPGHPLQQKVVETLERFTGERAATTVVDGCGAPVMAISLAGLARGMHRIATSSPTSPFALFRNAAHLRRAVIENPWTIAGPGRADTVTIEHLGVFAKTGAEGVIAMSTPEGAVVVVKILDGSMRVTSVVAVELLRSGGFLDDERANRALAALSLDVLGGGQPVGRIRSVVS